MRVHPEILAKQKLPQDSVGKRIWDERLADIANFEDYLTRQGTIILKFFLHLSREEQKKRSEKSWKFSTTDVKEREYWDDYMHAFEEAIQATRGSLRRGMLCPPITSGSQGLSSPPLLWKRWRTSDLVTHRSMT